jgi:hypothetical protein
MPHNFPPFTTADADRLLRLADNAFKSPNQKAEWAAIRPLLMLALALLQLLDDSRGALTILRRQVDRLRAMTGEEDFAAAEACNMHDDVARNIDDTMFDLMNF